MYADDNKDYLVPYSNKYQAGAENTFFDMLNPYLRPGATFATSKNYAWRCPSEKNRVNDLAPPAIMIIYSFSTYHYMHTDGMRPMKTLSFKRSEVVKPTETPSFMDSSSSWPGSGSWPVYCKRCFPAGGSDPSPGEPNGIGFRHTLGANVGYVEGHVGWTSLKAILVMPDFFRHFDHP